MAKFNFDRDARRFARAWEDALGPREVAEAFGLSYEAAKQAAVRLRRRGVPLKRFRNPKPNYKGLADMVRERRTRRAHAG